MEKLGRCPLCRATDDNAAADDDDEEKMLPVVGIKTWVPLDTKPTSIRLHNSDTMEAVWICSGVHGRTKLDRKIVHHCDRKSKLRAIQSQSSRSQSPYRLLVNVQTQITTKEYLMRKLRFQPPSW